jgi:hypothetical protein
MLNWYKKAKKIIYVEDNDFRRLNLLVEKMVKGQHNWTPEDLQLQQTYPEAIEVLLKKHLNTSL